MSQEQRPETGGGGGSREAKKGGTGKERSGSGLSLSNLLQSDSATKSKSPKKVGASKAQPERGHELLKKMPYNVDQKVANKEQEKLDLAIERFKAIPENGEVYSLPGINTPLKLWQLLAAYDMLKREDARKSRGGGLFMDMGMGKTLTTLALIVHANMNFKTKQNKNTLVIVPNITVVANWMNEVQIHCEEELAGTMVHYQSSNRRFEDKRDLIETLEGRMGIVFATYDEVRKDAVFIDKVDEIQEAANLSDEQKASAIEEMYKESNNHLFKHTWYRIVLDEAHAIKNHRSKSARSVLALRKKIGWLVTGTPLANEATGELFPYLRFIGDEFSQDKPTYDERYRDLSDGNLADTARKCFIRWNTSDTFLGRPVMDEMPKNEYMQVVELSEAENIIYEAMKGVFRRIVNKIFKEYKERASGEESSELLDNDKEGSDDAPFDEMVEKATLAANNAEEDDEEDDEEIVGSGKSKRPLAIFLKIILRLRQGTCHPYLLERTLLEDFTISELRDLQDRLRRSASSASSEVPFYKQIGTWQSRFTDKAMVEDDQPDYLEPFGTDRTLDKFDIEKQLEAILNFRLTPEPRCTKCRKRISSSPMYKSGPEETKCAHFLCCRCIVELTIARKELTCPDCKAVVDYKTVVQVQHLDAIPDKEESEEEPAPKRQRGRKVLPAAKKRAMTKKRKTGDDYQVCQPKPRSVASKLLSIESEGQGIGPVPSGKLIALKDTILRWQIAAPGDKIIVFTQYILFAQIIGRMLQAEKINFLYYAGAETVAQKESALKLFHEDDGVKILVASLTCGGQSLNITCANRVVIMEPWWNNAREKQAFGRVNRIGQMKPTLLIRMKSNNTVEEDINEGQKRKEKDIHAALLDARLSTSSTTLHKILSLLGRPVVNADGVLELVDDNEDTADLTADHHSGVQEATTSAP